MLKGVSEKRSPTGVCWSRGWSSIILKHRKLLDHLECEVPGADVERGRLCGSGPLVEGACSCVCMVMI